MALSETNLTISPDQFSIDSFPSTVEERFFDGTDSILPEIEFEHPKTGEKSFERSQVTHNFGFNGTALLSPSAFDNECADLTVDTINRSRLSGELLILDLEPEIQYGRAEVRALLEEHGIEIDNDDNVPQYIILFRTRLMQEVLETTDDQGCPNYDQLADVQAQRPGLTAEGAAVIAESRIARAVMVDNISFEVNGTRGYHATQILAAPDINTGDYTPLVYHVGNTEGDDFMEKHQGKNARIEIGNPPKQKLTGYPVGVFIEQ